MTVPLTWQNPHSVQSAETSEIWDTSLEEKEKHGWRAQGSMSTYSICGNSSHCLLAEVNVASIKTRCHSPKLEVGLA